MEYIITFLEGIISFISPCMLPLLPVYVSYFAGDGEKRTGKVLTHAVCFVLGFSAVFILLGIFAGTLGRFLQSHRMILNIVCGIIVAFLGVTYITGWELPFLKGTKGMKDHGGNILATLLFGMIYAVSLTPCIGVFLGSALMLASTSETALKGALLLLCYSLGLGIPFVLSALLLDKLRKAFTFIKKHYRTVNIICGIFLIVVGLLMATGLLNKVMLHFS